MAKYLLSSFRHLLQVKLRVCVREWGFTAIPHTVLTRIIVADSNHGIILRPPTQERALLQSLEVQELLCGASVSQQHCPDVTTPKAAHLPETLARFTAAWTGAEHVLVAHNEVCCSDSNQFFTFWYNSATCFIMGRCVQTFGRRMARGC
jgi:hypothetical protein